MYFKQFYLGCLAHASYLIGSGGEAAVVDPQRDVEQYINEAEAEGLKIRYVIETHLHADFVSGHRELAERTGAKIVFGRNAGAATDYAVEVWPAHGKGSLCGRNMSNETSSTIGRQRRLNSALQPMTKEEFVKMMTADLPEVPAYFSKDAEINRGGARSLADLPRPAALSPAEVNKLAGCGATILDVRANTEFGAGHAPGALNIGLGGPFDS